MILKELEGLSARWAKLVPGEDVSTVEPVAKLGGVARLMERFHKASLKPFDLEWSDYQVLATLWTADAADGFSPTQLSRTLGQTSAGMTKTLDRLERQAAIRRHPDPGDRRGVLVRLTPAGKKLAKKACLASLEAQQELFADFDAAELRALNGSLDRVLEGLFGA